MWSLPFYEKCFLFFLYIYFFFSSISFDEKIKCFLVKCKVISAFAIVVNWKHEERCVVLMDHEDSAILFLIPFRCLFNNSNSFQLPT